MDSKYIVKSSMVLFSLVFPVFAVWLLFFSINYFEALRLPAMCVYAFSLAIAMSSFCRKMSYRIVIAMIAFLIAAMCASIWEAVALLFMFSFAAAMSINFIPRNWNGLSLLMLPYILLRVIIAYMGFGLIWAFNLFDGDFLKPGFIELLSFTYCQIFIILIFDLIVYCIIKAALGKKDPAV